MRNNTKGNQTRYEYTLTSKLKKVIDALGNETCYTYDVCDRLIEIRQYEGKAEEGKEVTNADGKAPEASAALKEALIQNKKKLVTRYDRDLQGNVTTITDAQGLKEHYTYDKKGQLLSKLDREGYLTNYQYSSAGDVTNISYADGRDVKLSYNALRHLEEMEDWLGVTRIETDSKGRAKKVTYPKGEEVSYTYGLAGERTGITYPDGKEVKYEYDPYLRLAEVKSDDVEVTYGFDEAGRLSEKRFENGMKSYYRYDQKGQLLELVHSGQTGELDRYEYGYDLLGNKNHIKKQRRGLEAESGSYEYQYDALNQLSGVVKDGMTQREYAYDPFHNRSSMKEWVVADGSPNQEGPIKTDYMYNIAGRLVSLTKGLDGSIYSKDIEGDQTNGRSVLEETYNYDKRGNLTHIYKDGQLVNQYYYGALNRLESAMNYESGLGATYQLNGLGNRVGKVEGTPIDQVLPTAKIVKLDLNPTKDIDDVLDLTKQYHNLLQRSEDANITAFTWDNNVLAATGTEGVNNYFQDELGSPVRMIERLGKEPNAFGYDEFGRDIYQGQKEIQTFGFTGYQQDSIANTYFAQAREYRSDVGRFAAEDIIKGNIVYPFSINQYTYCWNQPIRLVDLNGLFPSLSDIGKGISDVASKVGNAVGDFISSDVGKVVLTVGAIAIVGTVSVITAGAGAVAVSGVLASVAAGAAGGATVGGISNMITGGSFANGFAGGAISGGIGALGTAIGMPHLGNFVGGAIGSSVTTYLDDPNVGVGEITIKSLMGGATQMLFGASIGKLFDGVANTVTDKTTKVVLEYFKSVYDVGGSVIGEILYQIFFSNNNDDNRINYTINIEDLACE